LLIAMQMCVVLNFVPQHPGLDSLLHIYPCPLVVPSNHRALQNICLLMTSRSVPPTEISLLESRLRCTAIYLP
jgi:hypothetical protein